MAATVRVTTLGVAMLLAACSAIDPQQVGRGGYMQVMSGADVLMESDAARSGFQNCTNSAYQLMQANKIFEGRIKCADAPSAQALPFTYRARNNKSTAADHVLPSGPYMVRARTSGICATSLASTRKEEKTEILEENCAGPSEAAKALGAAASGAAIGRFFQMGLDNELILQIQFSADHECAGSLSEMRKQLAATVNQRPFTFDCSIVDGAPKLKYRSIILDEFLGSPMTIAAKTELLCLNSVAELVKVMIPALNRPRYSTSSRCIAVF